MSDLERNKGTLIPLMTKRLKVYQDKNGEWWIWDHYLEVNVAIRQPTEDAARVQALHILSDYSQIYKESRDELRKKLDKVEVLFEELFGDDYID